MKAIIDGKRYDTDTARQIVRYSNGLGKSDFRFLNESLYRTPKGAFFLAGEGGAMTKYSEPYGDMRGEGSAITPLSDDEACEWLERYGFTDELEALFADRVQDA